MGLWPAQSNSSHSLRLNLLYRVTTQLILSDATCQPLRNVSELFFLARCHYTIFYVDALFDSFLCCALFWWSLTNVLRKKQSPKKALASAVINQPTAAFSTCMNVLKGVHSYEDVYVVKHMLPFIFMVSYNRGVRVNVIFVFSKKHNHVWCSVNHSGKTLQFKLKFSDAKGNQPSTRQPLRLSLFFFVLWQFSTQLNLNEDYDYVVSMSILVASFLETEAVGSSLRGLQNVQGLGL